MTTYKTRTKKKFKLLIGWNCEAAEIVEQYTPVVAYRKLQKRFEETHYVDFEIREFNTGGERTAFKQGIEAGNGWDDPCYKNIVIS